MSDEGWEAGCGWVGQWLGTDCRRGLEACRGGRNLLSDDLVGDAGHWQPHLLESL